MYILKNFRSSGHSYPRPTIMTHIYNLLIIGLVVVAAATFAAADRTLSNAINNMRINEQYIPKHLAIDDQTKTIRVDDKGTEVKPGSDVGAKAFSNIDLNRITWEGTGNSDDHCTVIFVDLDRKVKDSNASIVYNQFLSINIPDNRILAGQSITTYEPPIIQCTPNSKHRMLLIAYLQKQYMDLQEGVQYASSMGRNTDRRQNFDLKTLLSRQARKIVAVNTFYAQPDPSGTCNSSTHIKLSPILFLMVIASFAFSCSRKYH